MTAGGETYLMDREHHGSLNDFGSYPAPVSHPPDSPSNGPEHDERYDNAARGN